MSDADDFYNFNRGRAFEKIHATPPQAAKIVQVQDYGAALAIANTLKEVRAERDQLRHRVKQLECYIAGQDTKMAIMGKEIANCPLDHQSKDLVYLTKVFDTAYITTAKKNGLPLKKWSMLVTNRMKIYEYPVINSPWSAPKLDAQEAKKSGYYDSWVNYEKNMQCNSFAVAAVNLFLIEKINNKRAEMNQNMILKEDMFKDTYFSAFFVKAKELEHTPSMWSDATKKYAKEHNVVLKEYGDKDGYDIIYNTQTRNTIPLQLLQQLSSWVVAARECTCSSAGYEATQIKIMQIIKELGLNFPREELEVVYNKAYNKIADHIHFPRKE